MTQSRRNIFACVALTSTLVACGSGSGGGGAPSPSPGVASQKSGLDRNTAPSVPAADATELAAGNRAFAVAAYQQLRAQPGNLVFSPASISLALAMLYNGAASGTATQMASALDFTLPLERLDTAFDAMDLALTAPASAVGGFQLTIANSLWTQQGFTVEKPFLDALEMNFGAGVNTVDFVSSPETARGEINGWVSQQTLGAIPMLFPADSITDATRLVLVDAVYFHGDWTMPFAPNSPNGTFHAPNGDVTVPMMTGPDNVSLWNGTGWSAAGLGYQGGSTEMVLVVPDAGSFDAFEQGLTSDQLNAILTANRDFGVLSMPKFKFHFGQDLNATLAALGMPDAFTSAADFSGIDGQRDLAIQSVFHQADIAVDEQGTTADAATGIIVGVTGLPQHSLAINRPFLFFIVDDPTGAILFAGRVLDPSAS
jgi:serpin B